jgi:hypothetical protein
MLQYESNWEDLLKPPAPPPPPPRSVGPPLTSDRNPLQLFIPVKVLRKVINESLTSISHNRAKLDKTPKLKKETDALVEQRMEMNRWLAAAAGDREFFALYPVSVYKPE